MKKVLILLLGLVFMGSGELLAQRSNKRQASGGDSFVKKSVKRQASGSGGNVGQMRSAGGSSGGKIRKPSSGAKKSSSGKSSEPDVSSVIKCLDEKVGELLVGDCKFLFDNEIATVMGNEKLYCVLNNKSSGKIDSVYNYYLKQYYGISENGVKSSTSIIDVKDSKKGSLKYYQYLIEEINEGTLKESKIFGSIVEKVLENSSLSQADQGLIEKKVIEAVPLSISIISSDIEKCTKSSKAAMQSCNAIGDAEVKKKIADSCEFFNSALVKLAGSKRAEALGFEAELLTVLKQRVNFEFEDLKDVTAREAEMLELQKTQNKTKKEKNIVAYKGNRADKALEITSLMEEIATLPEGDTKKSKQDRIEVIKTEICTIDKTLASLEISYKPEDNLGCKAE